MNALRHDYLVPAEEVSKLVNGWKEARTLGLEVDLILRVLLPSYPSPPTLV